MGARPLDPHGPCTGRVDDLPGGGAAGVVGEDDLVHVERPVGERFKHGLAPEHGHEPVLR